MNPATACCTTTANIPLHPCAHADVGAQPRAGGARCARSRTTSRTSHCAPPFQRPPASAPRTTKRCGPPAINYRYVACLRPSATRRDAPSISAHGWGWPVRASGGTNVAHRRLREAPWWGPATAGALTALPAPQLPVSPVPTPFQPRWPSGPTVRRRGRQARDHPARSRALHPGRGRAKGEREAEVEGYLHGPWFEGAAWVPPSNIVPPSMELPCMLFVSDSLLQALPDGKHGRVASNCLTGCSQLLGFQQVRSSLIL